MTLFLTHPENKYYNRQISRDLNIALSAVQKELKNLHEIGLLESEREANIRFYKTNKSFPLYQEFKSIIYKTTGLADTLRENIKKIGNIEISFIYGSVARNTEDVRSDIDLMIIGNPDYEKLSDVVVKAEKNVSREINFTVMSPIEWKQKLAEKGFVLNLYNDKKIFIIGNEDSLRKIS